MTVEAEIGVMLPQAKECFSYQQLEEKMNKFFLRASRGVPSCQQFDWPTETGLRLLASRIVVEFILVALRHQVWGNLLQPS